MKLSYYNRISKKVEKEKVYGHHAISFLYGRNSFLRKTVGRLFCFLCSSTPIASSLYGLLQKGRSSRSKVLPFINNYDIDASEFEKRPESFSSFNDFFIRSLKPETRPIAKGSSVACIPADGRYQFFSKVEESLTFPIKNQRYTLEEFLQDKKEAKRFFQGSLVIGRLNPTDCHRFYFPMDCIPTKPRLINGFLHSVNPFATKSNSWIYLVNRRVITYLDSPQFGRVAFLEIGATSVGSIHQTFTPDLWQHKGQEKGYFSFGGSAIAMLFEKGSILFDEDLLSAQKEHHCEIKCLIGQSFGHAKRYQSYN